MRVAGPERGELLSEEGPGLVGGERRDVGELLALLRDRVHDTLVPVTDVHAHQLAVEVEEATAVGRVEVDALGVVDGERRDLRLRRPVVEGVALRELDDLFCREAHGATSFLGAVDAIFPDQAAPKGCAGSERERRRCGCGSLAFSVRP
jgi:hypothetical protein